MTAPGEMATSQRTRMCGTLRLADTSSTVRLAGWVHRRRDLGGLVFIDLRDRSGLVQVSVDPRTADAETVQAAARAGLESVIAVEGDVTARPDKDRNADLSTGDIEVRARTLRVIGPAATPAIPVARARGEELPAEEQRLRYRYLDLRRSELQHNLILRHRIALATRRYLSERGFVEVETPILTKPTPEGARDYLVPSRVHAGEFYALPQSPQLYKQLLMMAGMDRYFQIARCFRDEDLRADRQPEFTQIDIEASFVAVPDVLEVAEGLVEAIWREGGTEIARPVPRMTYADAMERYGTDRPDLRYALELQDVSALFADTDARFIRGALESGGRVRGIRVPGATELTNRALEELESLAKSAGAAGLVRLRVEEGTFRGAMAKFLPADAVTRLNAQDGDVWLLVAGPDAVSSPALDRVRQDVARRLSLVSSSALAFVWITEFPLFLRDAATGQLTSVNHPFTAPDPRDVDRLESAPESVRALAYDIVLNGTELGGGSIRIADAELQRRIFALLGMDEAVSRARFGFLLEALGSGAPPHGGIAFGLDRIAMLLSGAGSLRDVIAFPKTTAARALFEGAPSPVPADDLRELHLRVDGAS
ncbi:MAG TPA: aspartate--tRNA ligase [Gemmatimonadaceae bacterium]|nr:aspartate--tRNA ligase [Gemmatimonadaceae bacterium]